MTKFLKYVVDVATAVHTVSRSSAPNVWYALHSFCICKYGRTVATIITCIVVIVLIVILVVVRLIIIYCAANWCFRKVTCSDITSLTVVVNFAPSRVFRDYLNLLSLWKCAYDSIICTFTTTYI